MSLSLEVATARANDALRSVNHGLTQVMPHAINTMTPRRVLLDTQNAVDYDCKVDGLQVSNTDLDSLVPASVSQDVWLSMLHPPRPCNCLSCSTALYGVQASIADRC